MINVKDKIFFDKAFMYLTEITDNIDKRVSEYNYISNGAEVQTAGISPISYDIKGYLVGDDFQNELKSLKDTCLSNKKIKISHPLFNDTIEVIVTSFKPTYLMVNANNHVAISIKCTKSTSELIEISDNSIADDSSSLLDAIKITETEIFKDAYNIVNLTQDRIDEINDFIDSTFDELYKALKLVDDAVGIIDSINDTILNTKARIENVITYTEGLANELNTVTDEFFSFFTQQETVDYNQITAYDESVNATLNADIESDDEVVIENCKAIQNLYKLNFNNITISNLNKITFSKKQDLDIMIDTFNDNVTAIEQNTDNIDKITHITDLKSAVSLTLKNDNLKNLTIPKIVTTDSYYNSILLAYSEYGDITKAIDLLQDNNVLDSVDGLKGTIEVAQ